MKTLIVSFCFIVLFNQSNASFPNCELYIENRVPDQYLYIRLYPVGAIFQKDGTSPNALQYYTSRSKKYVPGDPLVNGTSRRGEIGSANKILYMVGLDGYALENRGGARPGFFELQSDSTTLKNWLFMGNDASTNSDVDGLFGFGKFKLEVWTDNTSSTEPIASIPIDWLDFNYPSQYASHDLFIRIYNLSPLIITFQWAANIEGEELPLFGTGSPPYNGGIQVYKQYHRYVNGNWEGYNLNGEHPPSRGNSVSDKYFLTFPIDGRNLPSPYTIPRHDSAGVFKGNLTIDTNVYTSDSLFESPTKIVMSKMTFLKVNGDDSLILSTPSYPQTGYVDLIIEDSSTLDLHGKIIIEDRNKLTLKSYSFLRFQLGSAIIVKPGAVICNEGAEIKGPLNFLYEKGTHLACPIVNDFVFKDSSRIVLLDSAELIFPNDYTLHLKGHETALILNPGSKLLFGENSGIVCDSGARIVANDAMFASVDSTKKWNGISLNDLASDTIRNCTIKNAMYGIMISDRYDPEESPEPYSAEISGCSFVNQTSQVLNNAVYLQNSAHVLLKDNTVSATNLGIGFTHGIYAEYSAGEMLNIINNPSTSSGQVA
jgi:hypothetical protein